MVQDLWEIKRELVVFFRNQDIISTASRGVTTEADTGTFSSDSSHTLGNSPTLAKNVRSVIVGGSTLVRYTDYTVNYDTGVITFASPQSGDYTISYDQGSPDRIFPDYPQGNIKLSGVPRMSVDILGSEIKDIDLGAKTTRHDYVISITFFSKGVEELEDGIKDIQDKILNNKKTFYYLEFITPKRIGPALPTPGGEHKILKRTIDCDSKLNFETV